VRGLQSMSDMDERTERRSQPRRPVTGVGGLLRVKTEAEVLNLSLTGAAVATASRLPMGETYRLHLRQGPRRLELAATVARSTLRAKRTGTAPRPVYEMGLQFLEVLGDRGQEVARFLAEQAKPEMGGRICDRFLPPPGTRAEIEYESEFDLRSISPAGLAIETGVEVDPGQEVALEVRLGKGFATTGKVVYRLPVAPGRFQLGIESTPAPHRLPPEPEGVMVAPGTRYDEEDH
jgi:hypothetical protein